MQKVRKEDMELVFEAPGYAARRSEWGGMTTVFEQVTEPVDPEPVFAAALPDGRCQCPHWGYVLEGEITFRYADHDQVVGAGEAYYAPPGHVPLVERSVSLIELSPTAELNKTIEAVQATMAASQS